MRVWIAGSKLKPINERRIRLGSWGFSVGHFREAIGNTVGMGLVMVIENKNRLTMSREETSGRFVTNIPTPLARPERKVAHKHQHDSL